MDKTEKRFERDIETFLISNTGGYTQFVGQNEKGNWVHNFKHDVEKCIYLDILIQFIEKTQPKAFEKYKRYYPNDYKEKFYRRLEDTINDRGLIYVLKNGIEDMGIKLKICYFKPESNLNEELNILYNENILGCTRQFNYSTKNNNTIDMVLSINGIPIVALELKNQFTGQDYKCAINQYKKDRDFKEFCFRLNHRFLVYFAVDLYQVYMTTQLKGNDTYFMPFNQGSNGVGNTGGRGNPQNTNSYATFYLWEEVLQKDSLLELIQKFISFTSEKEEINNKIIKKERLIFPRYHQYDVVKKIVKDVKQNGAGQNYLIQHSAGSGKSNSIAWIAYRLASIHKNDKPVFDSVIVVTNRVVLDSQLQDTINSFEHTPGLVEAIDNKKRSKGLADAINDKKRIIICTIQKFLFAYKDLEKMKGSNFAIIVDEAHQGQSGESAKTLRKSLLDLDLAKKEYAQMEDIEENEVDLEDDCINEIIGQGKHKNQSFFAFTATPKYQTIELFGKYNEETKKTEPFHIYSMRQAIEENFIVDVLKNYTTIKEAFKLVKVSEDNPELVEGEASKALFKYYKQHGYTIKQKTEMIMSNFLENGRFQINKKGKAMIVADSRANAVRYYFAIKDYIKNNQEKAKGSDVMVAFSGIVNLDGIEYTESMLNLDEDNKTITSDKKFRKAFRSDKYNILVVANKYQTGFDEPLLHSMYVDKKLKSVNAVQTLSRLNRICPFKENTFVLDFENTVEDIKEAFQPFYEATFLDGNTNINTIYDIRNKIKDFRLYSFEDVKRFKDFMLLQSNKKQSQTALGRLSEMLKPVVLRYEELEQEEKYIARDCIRKFNKAYSYVTQLVRIHDKELFEEFLYTKNLIKLLPKDERVFIDIDDKIKLEYSSLKETFNGAIELDKKTVDFEPNTNKPTKINEKKKDTLQSIIDRVNERFDGDFTQTDKVIIEGIYQMFMNDVEIKKFKQYAKDNNIQMFVDSLFPDKFRDIVTNCFIENNASFQKLFDDTEFYQKVMEVMANEIYKSLKKD